MRHRKKGRHFSRTAEHRQLMLRNMAASLFRHGRIEASVAAAKELRRFAEPLITKVKWGALRARRLVAREIRDAYVVARLFYCLGPRYASRNGGYTRVLQLGHRAGDAADVAIIELVE